MLLTAPVRPTVLHALLVVVIHRELKIGVTHDGMAEDLDTMISRMTRFIGCEGLARGESDEDRFDDPEAVKRVLVAREQPHVILQPGFLLGKQRYEIQAAGNQEWRVLVQADIVVCIFYELIWGRYEVGRGRTPVIIPRVCRYGIRFVVIEEINVRVVEIGCDPKRALYRVVVYESHIFLEVGWNHGN